MFRRRPLALAEDGEAAAIDDQVDGNPSAWRSGKWQISRNESAVSMAGSEYFRWPPRTPAGLAFHASMASGPSQMVMSPRCTRARSYAAQLPKRYFVSWVG